MTSYVDSTGRSVHLGQELGVGGQGAVYAVAGDPRSVAKIYLKPPGTDAIRKLEALVRVATPSLQSVSAWPQAVLKDPQGHVQGFVMPLVPEAEYRELHFLYNPSLRRQSFPTADWRFLVHVARNVALAFAALHEQGSLMGDVSARNVMVSTNGTVRFIDTDSFQVQVGIEVFPCPVSTAEYTPPELQGKAMGTLIRDVNHDRFGLALLIFHLLFEGRHPFAGVHLSGAQPDLAQAIAGDKFAYSQVHNTGVKPPPFTPTLSALPSGLRNLFEDALSPRHTGRPAATQWVAGLTDLLAQIVPCAKNSDHLHDRRVACPWCTLLPANARVATAKTGLPGGAKRIDVDAELNRIWAGIRAVPVPAAPKAWTPRGQVALMPVPAVPPLAAQSGDVSWVAAVWGAATALSALMALTSEAYGLSLLLAAAAWWCFAQNSAVKRHRRGLVLEATLKARQRDEYQRLATTTAGKYRSEADALRRQLDGVMARLQQQSAHSQYQAAVRQLDTQRRAIQLLDQEEQREMTAMIERHRQPLLERYLEQHLIRPGDVQGIGPSVLANLHQRGIRTAKDIDANVRWVKGVGPKRQQDLFAWRILREQNFIFDPNTIPPKEFDLVRDRFDAQRRTQLGQLETASRQFIQAAPTWAGSEQALTQEIQTLRQELARREATIQHLNDLPAELK